MSSLSGMRSAVQRVSSGRFFSTTRSTYARKYESVVNRHIAQEKVYEEGDLKPWHLRIPDEAPKYPTYPYGEARIFKRSDRGLYGGQEIGSGFQVSSMGNRTPRAWLPNVITKRLWSEALNRLVRMKLTARVLRTITKEGGLDNYLTKDKSARIKELGIFGWHLRYDVLKAREESVKGANYEVVKQGEDGEEVKVYYKGEYKGQPVQITVGRRKLLSRLFPKVQYNTPGELRYAEFSVKHAKTPFDEVVKECEKFDVDLSDVVIGTEVRQASE
ncbi:DEKNAAC101182 [Brettanomyces naardenensis]|uniref:Large ribosomal subunit protein bL28m n=1 Tax=Brettanomyces naardenensis TaxID=13370 RepID=A0A448YH69_BRENA|nr:DEKNAAC101182 [Brettanomyces naardenensis]